MLPPIAPSLGATFFCIITIPISIYRGGDGDDSFGGGSHVQQVWEGRHLNPPERHLGKPEAPVEERHTGFFLLLLRFLRSCAWCGCRCTRFSACGVMTYRIPRHTGRSPHRSKYLSEEPFYVRLSGAEGEELTATLALRRGVFGLLQPPADI